MKKIITMVLCFLLLAGCTTDVGETTAPTETTFPAETMVPETSVPETTVPEETMPVGFADYECRYTDERDLHWEEDVVYLAKIFLGENVIKGHPYLIDESYQKITMDNRVRSENFYNEELRIQFIDEINGLIDQIPELTDAEIPLELNRVLALLGDAHSAVGVPYEKLFAIDFEEFYEDGKVVLYTTMIPQTNPELMYARLVAINGVSAEEIVDLLRAYIPSENEYWEVDNLSGIYFSSALIVRAEALRAVGVMGDKAESAVFTLETVSGETVDFSLDALTMDEWYQVPTYGGDFFTWETLMYRNYYESNYWYEYLEEEDTLYLRIHRFDEEEENRFDNFCLHLNEYLRDLGGVHKFVVDVRNNPGGYGFYGPLIDVLNGEFVEDTYILIDGGSFSQAVNAAAHLRAEVEGAQLIGTPAGQPPNFWGGVMGYEMRNSGTYFQMPNTYALNIEDHEGDTLMPDIIVYQTIEDYMEQIDTVLEAVMDFE